MARQRIPEPEIEPEGSNLRNALFRLKPEARSGGDSPNASTNASEASLAMSTGICALSRSELG